jgi:hypothetical protein
MEADPSVVGNRPEIDIDVIVDDDKFWESIHELRPELYAITALATDYTVTNAYQKWEQDHSLSPEAFYTAKPSIKSLPVRLNHTLRAAVPDALDAMESEYPGIIDRYKQLTRHFLLTYESSRYESIEGLIESGIGTATKETVKAIEAISRTCKLDSPDIGDDEIIAIARRSSGIILKAASVNLGQLPVVSGLLEETNKNYTDYGPENPVEVLKLTVDRDGLKYVNFIGPMLNLPDPNDKTGKSKLNDAELVFETLGCPAILKFGDSPTVVKLWNWVIDIVDQEKILDQISK